MAGGEDRILEFLSSFFNVGPGLHTSTMHFFLVYLPLKKNPKGLWSLIVLKAPSLEVQERLGSEVGV